MSKNIFESKSKRMLASQSLWRQIYGALLGSAFVVLLMALCLVASILWGGAWWLAFVCVAAWLVIAMCGKLTTIFSLRKKESRITWSQIAILIVIGMWIVSIVLIYDVKSNPRFATGIAIAGAILTWIFQDTVKGVAAFIHLRLNGQLRIDDWIQLPKYDVDGMVTRVTLTTVTVYNWDTTTSCIPTSVLHTDHFINLQKMMEGKTYGRRMLLTFIFDTGWIHALTQDDISILLGDERIKRYLSADEIAQGATNASLYRLYLYHYLMNHPHISQQPRLIVRWLEQKPEGMPLQLYAFITDSGLVAFEWQQSLVVEHVVESLQWFGLRLFQTPSNYDVSNSNIYLSSTPATYRNEP